MDLTEFIGYPKNEVLRYLKDNNINYKIIEIDENKFWDTELFVKFEKVDNIYLIYFDKFKLNI